MEAHKAKNLVCGVVATGVVLSYAYIGECDSYNIEKNHEPAHKISILPEGYEHNPYYLLRSEEQKVRQQIEIIHGFVSDLIENSEDLDPSFAETVSKHFWDLA